MQKLFFDIESTGIDPNKDRIVELAIRVVDEEGNIIVDKSKRYNPGVPIGKMASDIHGIKDKDVKDCPSFKSDAKKLKKMFEDKIVVMYNGLRFDIPLLMAEFERAGVDVELSGKFIDVLKVERKLSPHTLEATYFKYTGQKLEGAHGAGADVNATDVVMSAQKERNTLTDDDLMSMSDTEGMADYGGKLKYDSEGFLVFNFGKEKGKRAKDCTSYVSWILDNNSFSNQIKKLLRDEQTNGIKAKPAPKEKTGADVPPHRQEEPKGFQMNSWKGIQTGLDLGDDDLPF